MASFDTDEEYPKLLRARGANERELCTWEAGTVVTTMPLSLAINPSLVTPEQIYLFSLSKDPTWVHLDFINHSDGEVTMIWLNFCGAEVAYGLVRPGQHFDVWSFKCHPWVARRGSSAQGDRMMLGGSMVIFPDKNRANIPITQPPFLKWSLQTHKYFTADFRFKVKQLLLSHHVQGQAHLPTGKDMERKQQGPPSPITRSRSKSLSERAWSSIPTDVIIHVISFMAPQQRQCITLPPDGHPDIPPALLPYDPSTRSRGCLGCGGSHLE